MAKITCRAQRPFQPYTGFLDAQIRYQRVSQLLDSVQGLTKEQVTGYDLIPGDT